MVGYKTVTALDGTICVLVVVKGIPVVISVVVVHGGANLVSS